MEIKVKRSAKAKRRRDPHYRVDFQFMEGDADGEQSDSIEFDDKPEDVEAMKKFIMALECCNAAYPNGRGGYDEYDGLPEYDAFFKEELDTEHYEDFLEKQGITDIESDEAYSAVRKYLNEKYNPNEIFVDHPSDTNYISTSFDGYSVVHVDENGDETEVTITLSKEEKARLKEVEKELV